MPLPLISVTRWPTNHRYYPQMQQCLFLALLWLCLSACQQSGLDRPNDVLVVAQVAEPVSLDPHVATSLNDFRIIINLYEGLVKFRDRTLEPAPALAHSWEVSADGHLYTFHLKRHVRFHDGTAFDAAAVKFNFERMLNDDHPYHDTGLFPLAFFFAVVKEIRVLDSHTVAFALQQPFAPFLANLAYPTGLIVSPAAIKQYRKGFGRHPVGTGPFRFVEWSPKHRVLLQRNADYHTEPPLLQTVVFRPLTDPMTRVAELMADGVDMVTELSPTQVALLRNDPEFTVHEQAGPHLWFLILNTRAGPVRDRRLRRAVNYAIDRDALVRRVLQDTAVVAAGPVPAAFAWAYDKTLQPYPYDPEQARSLLAQAGYPDGFSVTFLVPQGGSGMLAPVQIAAAIQGDLARVGIRARIETYEWNSYLAKVNAGLAGQGDMAEMAWMTNDPDTLPYLALRSEAAPDQGGFNSGYYANATVDRLVERARTTADQGERAAFYRELQRLVQREVPWVVIASWKQHVVVNNRVRGFRLQPSFFLDLADTYQIPLDGSSVVLMQENR